MENNVVIMNWFFLKIFERDKLKRDKLNFIVPRNLLEIMAIFKKITWIIMHSFGKDVLKKWHEKVLRTIRKIQSFIYDNQLHNPYNQLYQV